MWISECNLRFHSINRVRILCLIKNNTNILKVNSSVSRVFCKHVVSMSHGWSILMAYWKRATRHIRIKKDSLFKSSIALICKGNAPTSESGFEEYIIYVAVMIPQANIGWILVCFLDTATISSNKKISRLNYVLWNGEVNWKLFPIFLSSYSATLALVLALLTKEVQSVSSRPVSQYVR